MKFSPELKEKIDAVKSLEELKTLAKAENIEATDEPLEKIFNANCKEGEIADEELDIVAGGTCCLSDGRPVVTVFNCCYYFSHINCGGTFEYIACCTFYRCNKCNGTMADIGIICKNYIC